MLNTERNTKTMGARILRAFKKWYRLNGGSSRRTSMCDTFFEHGQWWAQNTYTGEQYAVCDAEGSEANGVFDGFCFEQVTHGEVE